MRANEVLLCLCVPQLVVFAVRIGNERSVSFLLNYRPLVEHSDLVAELTRGQTVADIANVLNLTTEPRLQSPQHQNPLRLPHS